MMIKEIDGIKDYYITSTGIVYSNRTGTMREIKGYDNKGYRQVEFYGKCYKVHRLVALNFIPNPENLPQVNHINGIKSDNRVENLEWCDNSHNQIHAWENNLQPSGSKRNVKNRSLSFEDVENIRKEYETLGTTHKRLAEKYGVSKTTIGDALRGKNYSKNETYQSARKPNNRMFTLDQANAIREEYKSNPTTYTALASKYEVNITTISDIINNRTYVE